jgi:hypothetical protein
LRYHVKEDIAVDQDGGHSSPRVRAMISSVVIGTSPVPRK